MYLSISHLHRLETPTRMCAKATMSEIVTNFSLLVIMTLLISYILPASMHIIYIQHDHAEIRFCSKLESFGYRLHVTSFLNNPLRSARFSTYNLQTRPTQVGLRERGSFPTRSGRNAPSQEQGEHSSPANPQVSHSSQKNSQMLHHWWIPLSIAY